MINFDIVVIYDTEKDIPTTQYSVCADGMFSAMEQVIKLYNLETETPFTINVTNKENSKNTLAHFRPNLSEEQAIASYESYRMNEVKR